MTILQFFTNPEWIWLPAVIVRSDRYRARCVETGCVRVAPSGFDLKQCGAGVRHGLCLEKFFKGWHKRTKFFGFCHAAKELFAVCWSQAMMVGTDKKASGVKVTR
jgi:hypothetical protein